MLFLPTPTPLKFKCLSLLPCFSLILSLKMRMPVFIPVHVISAADKVALGQGFLRVLRFSPVSTIPAMLHSYLHLHVTLTRISNGRRVGIFQIGMSIRKW